MDWIILQVNKQAILMETKYNDKRRIYPSRSERRQHGEEK